jgi:hypothetical protein
MNRLTAVTAVQTLATRSANVHRRPANHWHPKPLNIIGGLVLAKGEFTGLFINIKPSI